MDPKSLISSGLLELFVLDRLTPAERRRVEDMASKYPEIGKELDTIERALEAAAMQIAPEVEPGVLDRVLESIQSQNDTTSSTSDRPLANAESTVSSGSNILSSWLPWVLFAISTIAAGYFYQGKNTVEAQLNDTEARYLTLDKECEISQEALSTIQGYLNTISSATTKGVVLAGTDNAPGKEALVFYNPTVEQTLFKATNLPAPPTGKQYQLWAIDAQGPKSLGVLALDLSEEELLAVDYLADVAAFAITLEDEGGKPEPDLSQLQVIGNVG